VATSATQGAAWSLPRYWSFPSASTPAVEATMSYSMNAAPSIAGVATSDQPAPLLNVIGFA
jgi:hypothetical protein